MVREDDNYIRFLGTAGTRWVVARQVRASGGLFVHLEGVKIVIDPGPGSLVRCAEANPPIEVTELDALILTHRHIDHCNDVNILIDSMTGGGLNRQGTLFAPEECVSGDDPVVWRFVQRFIGEIVVLEPKTPYQIGDVTFTTSILHHHWSDTYGLLFDVAGQKLSFISDTRYFPELASAYDGSDVLVINVALEWRPESDYIRHLCVDDVREIVRQVRPQRVVLTHFGLALLEHGPERLAASLSDELGVEVVAATDGMRFNL